ncbi:MAG TPA: glucosamine-6-phosphate deaminase [Intrasporangium sp.]|uniref:glucosamine-6-phosphate deaminase n=1 Tax=Intrasporangium sp. TaxID=1925024 RepID=UPI002B48C5E8|nr:glucosamine-6-phosphate deaminase [Intrasporangium sp.]HKX69159.1 glucosamine-6-phosphate deaminase [Intrasporangium sp.]
MEIIVLPSAEEVAVRAAGIVGEALASATTGDARTSANLGLATGSSPLGLYRELTRARRSGEVDLTRVHGFALDEYVGLPAGHPQSYREVLTKEVCGPLTLDPANLHVPDGSGSTLDELVTAAAAYDDSIRQLGGIDVQILGIGSNGHIGFNEPGSALTSRTRVKRLSDRTRLDNARFFGEPEEVPTHCVTQGLGTILEARALVLVATGPGKAAAVAAAVEGPLTASCPASVLQWHARATVVVDEDAATGLRNREYYAEAAAGLRD